MRTALTLALAVTGLTLDAGAVAAQRLGEDMPMMRPHVLTYVGFDELEYLATAEEHAIEYDGELWIGGDFNRIWFKAAGEHLTADADGDLELQALYSRTVSSFWNAQMGVRVDHRYGEGSDTRALIGAGFDGLAPYWFEVEAFAFVSQDGDVSARLEASYDLLLTQRLVLESEVETDVAVQSVEEWGLRSGVNDIELGARMRYEIVREFAPYVGYSWTRKLAGTAELARTRGADVAHGALVLGLHWWY